MSFEVMSAEEYAKKYTTLSKKYAIFIAVLDPEKSEIAKIINIKVPGTYYAISK